MYLENDTRNKKWGQLIIANPLISLEPARGSNPGPADYESAALPLSYAGFT